MVIWINFEMAMIIKFKRLREMFLPNRSVHVLEFLELGRNNKSLIFSVQNLEIF